MVFGMLLGCIFILPVSYCNAETIATSEDSSSKVYDLQQNAFKYYQVNHKEALGIPISCSCAESEAGNIRKYTVEPKYSESINGNKVEKRNPYVEYAGVDHYPVISGDTVKINMTSKYDGDYSDYGNYDPVQYRVFISKDNDNIIASIYYGKNHKPRGIC
jgi:hypothetical protein